MVVIDRFHCIIAQNAPLSAIHVWPVNKFISQRSWIYVQRSVSPPPPPYEVHQFLLSKHSLGTPHVKALLLVASDCGACPLHGLYVAVWMGCVENNLGWCVSATGSISVTRKNRHYWTDHPFKQPLGNVWVYTVSADTSDCFTHFLKSHKMHFSYWSSVALGNDLSSGKKHASIITIARIFDIHEYHKNQYNIWICQQNIYVRISII